MNQVFLLLFIISQCDKGTIQRKNKMLYQNTVFVVLFYYGGLYYYQLLLPRFCLIVILD